MQGWGLIIAVIVFLAAGCGGSTTGLPQDDSLANQGFVELTKGNYLQAEASLLVALDLNPNNPYALLNLGAVYQDTGRTAKAVEMYEKILELNPGEAAFQSTRQEYNGEVLVEIAKENLKNLGIIAAENNSTIDSTESDDSDTKPTVFLSRGSSASLSDTAARNVSKLEYEWKRQFADMALIGGPSEGGTSGIGASAGISGEGASGSGSGSGGSGGGGGDDSGSGDDGGDDGSGADGDSGDGDDGDGGNGHGHGQGHGQGHGGDHGNGHGAGKK
jgi:hypothetical protein